jgi:hypothetical protein
VPARIAVVHHRSTGHAHHGLPAAQVAQLVGTV